IHDLDERYAPPITVIGVPSTTKRGHFKSTHGIEDCAAFIDRLCFFFKRALVFFLVFRASL
ncbi:hypothetical protein, partial [Bifidobacterium bohemicum]